MTIPLRLPLALGATIAALALGACGGDDDGDSAGTPATTTGASPPATTTQAAPSEPPFSPTYTFSGDEVIRCLKAGGLTAERESDPPAGDKAGQGVVHDRVLVGTSGDPGLRLFMFAAADLAKREGKIVTARSPNAQVLGTTILEPLQGDAAKETEAVIGCLKKQAR